MGKLILEFSKHTSCRYMKQCRSESIYMNKNLAIPILIPNSIPCMLK